jgi:hypothetical protein
MAYQYGVSVTTSTGEAVETIHCRNPQQQYEWLLHLREKYPEHRVFTFTPGQ